MPAQQVLIENDETTDGTSALPAAYFNAVSLSISLSDVSITTYIDQAPKQRLHMSLIVAKTLSEQLQRMIGEFEGAIDVRVPTMDETRAALSKLANEEPEE